MPNLVTSNPVDAFMASVDQVAMLAALANAGVFDYSTFTFKLPGSVQFATNTLILSNSLTLAGTDGSELNIGTGGTLGTAAFVATSNGGNGGADVGKLLQYISGGLARANAFFAINNSAGGIEAILAPTGLQFTNNGFNSVLEPHGAMTGAWTWTLPDSGGTLLTSVPPWNSENLLFDGANLYYSNGTTFVNSSGNVNIAELAFSVVTYPRITTSQNAQNAVGIKNSYTGTESYSAIGFIDPGAGTDEKGTIGIGRTNSSIYPARSVYIESYEGVSNDGIILPIRLIQTVNSGAYRPYRRMEIVGGSGPGDVVFFAADNGYPDETPCVVIGASSGRTRIGYNDMGVPLDAVNLGTLQLMTTMGAAACFSITQADVVTCHFGAAANSTTFVLGTDGSEIDFRLSPTASLAAGTLIFQSALSGLTLPIAGQGITYSPVVVASLPASPVSNQTAMVSDALGPVKGATVVGGGGFRQLVVWNGSNWVVL